MSVVLFAGLEFDLWGCSCRTVRDDVLSQKFVLIKCSAVMYMLPQTVFADCTPPSQVIRLTGLARGA